MRNIIFVFLGVFLCLNTAWAEVMFEVEEIEVWKFTPKTWCVKGLIRNLENRPIKGIVKIKFLNARNDIVHSTIAIVNDRDPLDPGRAGPFEHWTKSEYFEGVESFKVIFEELNFRK